MDNILLILISAGCIHAFSVLLRIKDRAEAPIQITKNITSGTKADGKRLFIIFSIGFYFLAIVQILAPEPPSSTGIFSVITNYLYANFGYRGMAVFWSILALGMLFINKDKNK